MKNLFEQRFGVLLLEDSPEDRELYRRQLAAMPGVTFDITEASSVQQAIDRSQLRTFDCYIIDYNLPDASGLDFVRHLFDQKKIQDGHAAIIIVTGQGSEEIAAEAFKLGVHEYLTKKSVSDGTFSRPVLNAIERAQLTSQIRHFQEQLEQSNNDLSEFTHTAAHDLKSPLRRILSYCEILQEDAATRLNAEDKRILERMRVNARRMHNLIDNLLSYSLIEYGQEEKHETDLTVLAQEVVSELEPYIAECDAVIDIQPLPKAMVYSVQIRQMLSNLISNALKYRSDQPPYIVIDAQQEGDLITVSVQDNGQGIPGDMKTQIFEDFKRLHANEDIEGTGLGLSICRKIAARHGGTIWVESKPEEGSTFYFTIRDKR